MAPEPRNPSICTRPRAGCGAIDSATNWRPCVLSSRQPPLARMPSPSATVAKWPTTVTTPDDPFGLTRRTTKPSLSLWNDTRSTVPSISSDMPRYNDAVASTSSTKYTYDDYVLLPDDGRRKEIIDGDL